jgi:hypothetical protein
MADRWMDERDREWRDRDWRRSERFGRGYRRGEDDRGREQAARWEEERSWSAAPDVEGGAYGAPGRRMAYDEDEEDRGGRAGYGSGRQMRYRGPATQGYRREDYADEASRNGERRGGWDFERARDEARSWGGSDERDYERGGERRYGEDQGYWSRGDEGGRERWEDRRDQGRGEGVGDLFQRAGERISSWFRGENPMRGEARRYSADFGREPRWAPERGHRGRGPRGYRRSDERISEEVHERLTDDPWLDASNIRVEVKDAEVTLSGHVDDREAKHRAERLIEDISGVVNVQNNLRVDPEAGLTSAGRGYGSSALEAEMRRSAQATSRGEAQAGGEHATGAGTQAQTDPKTGARRS